MKTIIKKISIGLLLLIALSSCEDFDESAVLTEGEKTGIEIKKLAEEKNITIVHISFGIYERFQGSFVIDGQYIIVNSEYFNLNYLFRIWYIGNEMYLDFMMYQ